MWVLIGLLGTFVTVLGYGLVTQWRVRRSRHRTFAPVETSTVTTQRCTPSLAVLLPWDGRSVVRRVTRAETRGRMTLDSRSW